jgi:hypothetical protein
MRSSPRWTAPGCVIASLRDGRGAGFARSIALLFASVAVLIVALPDGARAQPPDLLGTTLVDSLPPHAAVPATSEFREAPKPHSYSLTPFDEPVRVYRTYLPFAGNPAPKSYPEVSLGIGVGWYASSFRGAETAFRAVEDSIRRAGYSVPVKSVVHAGGFYFLSMNVTATPHLGASFQLGATGDQDNEVRLAGGLAWALWTSPEAPTFSLGAGLGGGAYRFHFNRKYGAVISPIDGAGGYTTLDYIRFEGGGAYATCAGRAVAEMSSHLAFDGTIQYMRMGDVASNIAGAGRQSINVSGLLLGLSFVVRF